jgi:COMPASS component SWD2
MKSPGSGPFLTKTFDNLEGGPAVSWTKLSFSNDGKYLLVSTNGNVLHVLDAMDAKLVHELKGHVNNLNLDLEASFTPDAKYITGGFVD